MRNASKHGLSGSTLSPSHEAGSSLEKMFTVRIVFCSKWEELVGLVDLDIEKDDDADGYSFIAVSVSRDFLNDPSNSKERMIGEFSLVSFLHHQFNEGIIDENGKVSPGNWGIKEMKTCAAFLGGESLYAVNDREPKFILVGSTKGNEIWSDGLNRICYVVRVEKPRMALALVPEHKHPKEHWEAVRFITELDQLQKGNVDYDFLYIDQERADEAKVLPERSRLPQRIVYGDFFGVDTQAKDDETQTSEPPIPKEIRLSQRLYDDALAQILETLGDKGKEFRLRLYFEDNDRAAAWELNTKKPWPLKGGRKIQIDFLKLLDNSPENKFVPDYKYSSGFYLPPHAAFLHERP